MQQAAQYFLAFAGIHEHPSRSHAVETTHQQSRVSPRRAAEAEAEVDPRIKEMPKFRDRPDKYTGKCFVVKDNIDTDQIIPAEYLTLVPSKVIADACCCCCCCCCCCPATYVFT